MTVWLAGRQVDGFEIECIFATEELMNAWISQNGEFATGFDMDVLTELPAEPTKVAP